MSRKLNYQSSYEEIGWSLRETLDEIQKNGETKHLKFEMLLKYGRLLLHQGKLNEAYQTFQQCSIYALENGVLDVKELYYWTSRCFEAQGDIQRALGSYLMLLERDKFVENDEPFVNEILDRIIKFGNVTPLINKYKKARAEEMANPKDLLGQVIKYLKENNLNSKG